MSGVLVSLVSGLLSLCFLMSVSFFLFSWDYLWADGVTIKKPIKVTAPQYVSYLMVWIQGQMEDETVFPTLPGIVAPDLLAVCFKCGLPRKRLPIQLQEKGYHAYV